MMKKDSAQGPGPVVMVGLGADGAGGMAREPHVDAVR